MPLVAGTILLITYLIVPRRGWWFDQREVINSFFINGAFFFVMLVRSAVQKPYSLELMHWMFCYFFFYFAPVIQFKIYYFPLQLEPGNAEILQVNKLVLSWGICFYIGSIYAKYVKGIKGRVAYGIRDEVLKVFAIIATLITIGMLAIAGRSLFNRIDGWGAFMKMGQSTALLLVNGSRAFVTFNVIYNGVHYQQEKKGQLLLIYSLICLLICCFPTGIARFQAAAIYIGIMIFFFPQLRRGTKFTYLFIFALIVLFPFMDAFRRQNFSDVNIIKAFSSVFQNMAYSYTEGHYDAFSIFTYMLRMLEKEGLYWGKLLLGAVFFFVPREIWPGKPEGTGNIIMEAHNLNLSNVSAPLPVEAYINFGVIGMLLVGVLAGWIVKKLDGVYWQSEEKMNEKKEWSYLGFFYPVALSLFFFFLRGDLMSTLSYALSFVVVGYIMFRYCGNFKK